MSLPVNLGFWIKAFIPIYMLLFLMIKVQLPAFRVAPISLAILLGAVFKNKRRKLYV